MSTEEVSLSFPYYLLLRHSNRFCVGKMPYRIMFSWRTTAQFHNLLAVYISYLAFSVSNNSKYRFQTDLAAGTQIKCKSKYLNQAADVL